MVTNVRSQREATAESSVAGPTSTGVNSRRQQTMWWQKTWTAAAEGVGRRRRSTTQRSSLAPRRNRPRERPTSANTALEGVGCRVGVEAVKIPMEIEGPTPGPAQTTARCGRWGRGKCWLRVGNKSAEEDGGAGGRGARSPPTPCAPHRRGPCAGTCPRNGPARAMRQRKVLGKGGRQRGRGRLRGEWQASTIAADAVHTGPAGA